MNASESATSCSELQPVDVGFVALSGMHVACWIGRTQVGIFRGDAAGERRSTWLFVWYRLIFGVAIEAGVAAGYLRN